MSTQIRSQNAPFTDEGFSLVQRDIETLFLQRDADAASSGVPTMGDVSTQGAAMPPDLPAGATKAKKPIATLPLDTVPVSGGGTGSTTFSAALLALGAISGQGAVLLTSTASATWTVPAGVVRALFLLIGGGGGAEAGSTSANVSSVFLVGNGGCGGGGGGVVCWADVTAGESLTYQCGALGAVSGGYGSGGSNGGDTTITIGALSLLASGGGAGGSNGRPGPGSTGGIFGPGRNYVGFVLPGGNGASGGPQITIGTSVNCARLAAGGQPALTLASNYGTGGTNGGSAAVQGAIYIFY